MWHDTTNYGEIASTKKIHGGVIKTRFTPVLGVFWALSDLSHGTTEAFQPHDVCGSRPAHGSLPTIFNEENSDCTETCLRDVASCVVFAQMLPRLNCSPGRFVNMTSQAGLQSG